MRYKSKDHLILGCPGAGKTHTLIDIAVSALKGIEHHTIDLPLVDDVDDIAFLSFTRKAAHEGQDRIAKEHGGEDSCQL